VRNGCQGIVRLAQQAVLLARAGGAVLDRQDAKEFGWPVTHAAIEAILDGAERQARAVIATWRDGVYAADGDQSI
jgi:hypothetical protein